MLIYYSLGCLTSAVMQLDKRDTGLALRELTQGQEKEVRWKPDNGGVATAVNKHNGVTDNDGGRAGEELSPSSEHWS